MPEHPPERKFASGTTDVVHDLVHVYPRMVWFEPNSKTYAEAKGLIPCIWTSAD